LVLLKGNPSFLNIPYFFIEFDLFTLNHAIQTIQLLFAL
jgi:hypothetical protein